MIGRSASKVPESTRAKVKAAQGQGYSLLGRGLCRGYNWQDPQGIWPKFEGLETIEDCAKECKKDKGCTAFDVSPSDVKSKFRCVLHGHGDIGNTVWKFKNFPVTQILRETNFGVFRRAKGAFFAFLKAVNFLV